MSIRLETSNTDSARRTLEHSKFKAKITVVCSKVKGSGNRPPTVSEIMEKKENNS